MFRRSLTREPTWTSIGLGLSPFWRPGRRVCWCIAIFGRLPSQRQRSEMTNYTILESRSTAMPIAHPKLLGRARKAPGAGRASGDPTLSAKREAAARAARRNLFFRSRRRPTSGPAVGASWSRSSSRCPSEGCSARNRNAPTPCFRRGTQSLQTHRWSKGDTNRRSPGVESITKCKSLLREGCPPNEVRNTAVRFYDPGSG